jgi:hypothetical protein
MLLREQNSLALAFNKSAGEIELGKRIVTKANEILITFFVKPCFIKWLIFGRDCYQAKFDNKSRLVSIVKLKNPKVYY